MLALSETWLNPDINVNLFNFSVFRANSAIRNSEGLLMAIRRTVPYSLVNNCFQLAGRLECMAVTVHFESFDLTIVSVYRHPPGPLSGQEYDSLFAFCDSSSHAILLGDFNAHHREWGCDRSDGESRTLFYPRLWARPSLA